MQESTAIKLIQDAINRVTPGRGDQISLENDLIRDKILDSLEIMNFLFELENILGENIDEIDETYNDFRIDSLVKIIAEK